MARPRKRKGGRVTPKGTRPRHWEQRQPAGFLPPELAQLLPKFDSDELIQRDVQAASFVGIFSEYARDDNVIDLRPDPAPEVTAADFLTVLEDFGPQPHQRIVDTVAAFAAHSPDQAAHAKRVLRSFSVPASASTQGFGEAQVVEAWIAEDIYHECVQYLLELRYPSGDLGAICVLTDRLAAGVVTDVLVIPDLAYFVGMMEDSGILQRTPADIRVVAAAIDRHLYMNDHTIGVDELIDDDVATLRPFIEKLLAGHDRIEVKEVELPPEARNEIADAFTAWARERHPETSDDVLSWGSLAVDFICDRRGGDPTRWAPNSVTAFLHWSTEKVMASPEELREIPVMLRLYLEWAHELHGWGEAGLRPCLEEIDRVMPMFEDAIAGPGGRGGTIGMLEGILKGVDLTDPDAIAAAITNYNEGLGLDTGIQPPIGGSHPEPFDASDLGPAAARATEVAELASVSARALFDDEYVTLVRRVTADAAAADPKVFARGKADIWASGVVYAVAQLNGIIGGWGPMTVFADDLYERLAGAPSTISSKATTIRRTLNEERWTRNPRYTHSRADYDLDSGFDLDLDLDLSDALMGHPGDPTPIHDRLPEGSGFVLRCVLAHTGVWRTVQVSASVTLHDLHQVLQRVFAWDDYHLHEFLVGSHRYGSNPDPDFAPDTMEDVDIRLDECMREGTVVQYMYDFGDGWEVEITVKELLAPETGRPRVELLDGAGDPPPEDCGGPWGYNNLIKVLGDPDHPEYAELREWAGDFQPGSFDLEAVAARVRLD